MITSVDNRLRPPYTSIVAPRKADRRGSRRPSRPGGHLPRRGEFTIAAAAQNVTDVGLHNRVEHVVLKGITPLERRPRQAKLSPELRSAAKDYTRCFERSKTTQQAYYDCPSESAEAADVVATGNFEKAHERLLCGIKKAAGHDRDCAFELPDGTITGVQRDASENAFQFPIFSFKKTRVRRTCNARPVVGDEKTRTAAPAVFEWAKCVDSPNPFVARWLGSTANAMSRQISLSRDEIFELRSGQVSSPVCGCSACPFSDGLTTLWAVIRMVVFFATKFWP
jgi:hypothetical protein